MAQSLDADYLVVGAGRGGDGVRRRADRRTPTCSVVMVDRRHSVGGHWLDAYPFVRLHQASAFYGVASTLLGGGRVQAGRPGGAGCTSVPRRRRSLPTTSGSCTNAWPTGSASSRTPSTAAPVGSSLDCQGRSMRFAEPALSMPTTSPLTSRRQHRLPFGGRRRPRDRGQRPAPGSRRRRASSSLSAPERPRPTPASTYSTTALTRTRSPGFGPENRGCSTVR